MLKIDSTKDKPVTSERVVKNTFWLYLRMFIVMLVSFYTSRVVLNVLGVVDYGINNVVGGFVSMLSVLNGSLATATQRFLNFEMGVRRQEDNNESLSKVFGVALTSHWALALLVALISELVGIYFIKNVLTIPSERLSAAYWVFHFSVLSASISIVSAPYNAAIQARQRMNVYAAISLLEVVLKLALVLLLSYVDYDKLILFAFFQLISSIILRYVYWQYCVINFTECRSRWRWDRKLFTELLKFSGWMVFGVIADMLSKQGVNMLLNVFGGPVCNAARGIGVTAHSSVVVLARNFITAARPQAVQAYAGGNLEYSYRLIFGTSKISFYLLGLLIFPVLVHTDVVLLFWLKQIPPYSVLFVRLMLLEMLVTDSYAPIAFASQASGKIRNYQLIVSLCYTLVFLTSWGLLALGFAPSSVFIGAIIVAILGLFARLLELKVDLSFPSGDFIRRVLTPAVLASAFVLFGDICLARFLPRDFLVFIMITIINTASLTILFYFGVLSLEERTFATRTLSKIFTKFRKNT